MENFNARIKSLRENGGLSHSQMASIFDKSEGAIRAWETGRAKPDVDTLIKIANYFHVTADYLLGRTDYKNPGNKSTMDTLGLSEAAINSIRSLDGHAVLKKLSSEDHRKLIDVLSQFIENKEIMQFLGYVQFLTEKNHFDYVETNWAGSQDKPTQNIMFPIAEDVQKALTSGEEIPQSCMEVVYFHKMAHDSLDKIIEEMCKAIINHG